MATCTNIRILKEKAANTKARTRIDRLLEAHDKQGAGDNIDFSANHFRRLSIITPQDKLERLLETEAENYRSPILELQRMHGKLALIFKPAEAVEQRNGRGFYRRCSRRRPRWPGAQSGYRI